MWAFFSSYCLCWNILFSVLDACSLTHFDSEGSVSDKSTHPGLFGCCWPGGKDTDQGISWYSCRSCDSKFLWKIYVGVEYEKTREEGERRPLSPVWDLKVKLWAGEEDWKWVLINGSKCSAESGFTRLNRIRIPRTEAGEQGTSFIQIS